MNEPINERLAKTMFEAYSKASGGKTWDGKPIPPWNDALGDIGPKVRSYWIAAADSALDMLSVELDDLFKMD
jgi:hypothetical protein